MNTDPPPFWRISSLEALLLIVLISVMSGCGLSPQAIPAQSEGAPLTPLSALMNGQQVAPAVSEGSPDVERQALAFAPPPGMAGLYVIRPHHFVGGLAVFPISIDDGEKLGILKMNSYLFAVVPPGEHVLLNNPKPVSFTAEAGRNYFFSTLVREGMEPISEVDGKNYIKKFTLSGDNVVAPITYPETAKYAAQVEQNWPKLSEELTIQQVLEFMPIIGTGSKHVSWAETIGPEGVLMNYTMRLSTGFHVLNIKNVNYTVRLDTRVYELNFKNGKLASWTPR
jgi:hypothetical protein